MKSGLKVTNNFNDELTIISIREPHSASFSLAFYERHRYTFSFTQEQAAYYYERSHPHCLFLIVCIWLYHMLLKLKRETEYGYGCFVTKVQRFSIEPYDMFLKMFKHGDIDRSHL